MHAACKLETGNLTFIWRKASVYQLSGETGKAVTTYKQLLQVRKKSLSKVVGTYTRRWPKELLYFAMHKISTSGKTKWFVMQMLPPDNSRDILEVSKEMAQVRLLKVYTLLSLSLIGYFPPRENFTTRFSLPPLPFPPAILPSMQ